MAAAVASTTKAYWEHRFRTNWQELRGPEQTLFFARLFADSTPLWFRRLAAGRSATLIDIGCAEGQAVDYLKAALGVSSAAGMDVSEAAIGAARESFPDCRFSVVDLERDPVEPADIVYCSNVLQLFEEHSRDELLGKVIGAASLAAVLLVPFSDAGASSEEKSGFGRDTLPFSHSGAFLAFAKVLDAAERPDTWWLGEQLAVIYVKAGVSLADPAIPSDANSDGYARRQLHKARELQSINGGCSATLTVRDLLEGADEGEAGDEKAEPVALVLDRMLGLETSVRTTDGRWRIAQQEARVAAERLARLVDVPTIQSEFDHRQQRLALQQAEGFEELRRTTDSRWRAVEDQVNEQSNLLHQQSLRLRQLGAALTSLSASHTDGEEQQTGQLVEHTQDLAELRQIALESDDRAQARAEMLKQITSSPEGIPGLHERIERNAETADQTAELLKTVLARLESQRNELDSFRQLKQLRRESEAQRQSLENERKLAERRHRSAVEELNEKIEQVKVNEVQLVEQHAREMDGMRARAESAEQVSRLLQEQKTGLEQLRSNEAAQARYSQIELSALRRRVRDLESAARGQRGEVTRLNTDLRLAVQSLEREQRERQEQAWRYETSRIGFHVSQGSHRALDLLRAATPEFARRAVRGIYLPLYRTVFPHGHMRFEKPHFEPSRPEAGGEYSAATPDGSGASEISRNDVSQPSLPSSGAPRVSVVIPVWNYADLLGDALLSVLGQSYSDIQVIVVDDGSTDKIEAILQAFSDDPRVTIIRRAHEGLPHALNAGFRVADGDLWTWTSADNLMHPEMITTLVEFMRRHPDADMTFANMDLISESGQPLPGSDQWAVFQNPEATNELLLPRDTTALGLMEDNFIGACFLYRAEIGRLLGGYNESLMGVEDYDFWLRLSEFGSMRHVGLNQPLYHYRVHSRTLTENRRAEVRAKGEALIRNQRERVGNYRRRLSILLLADHTDERFGRTVEELKHALEWDGHQVEHVRLAEPSAAETVHRSILEWRGSLEADSWRMVVCFADPLALGEAARVARDPQTIVAAWIAEGDLTLDACAQADWILTDSCDAWTHLPEVKRNEWSQLLTTTVSTEFDLPLCLKAREGAHPLGDWLDDSSPVFLYLGPTEETAVDWQALGEAIETNPLSTFLLVSTEGDDTPPGRLPQRENLKHLGRHPVAEWHRFLSRADVLLAPFASEPAKRAAFHDTIWAYLCAGKPIVATSEVRKLGLHTAPSVWLAEVGEFGETARSLLEARVDVEAVDKFRKTRSIRSFAKRLASVALVRLEQRNKRQSPAQRALTGLTAE